MMQTTMTAEELLEIYINMVENGYNIKISKYIYSNTFFTQIYLKNGSIITNPVGFVFTFDQFVVKCTQMSKIVALSRFLEYCEVPTDLSVKEAISYYQLLGIK